MYLSSFQQNISIHIKYHKYVHVHQTTAADTISTRNIVPTKLTLSQTTLGFFFLPWQRGLLKILGKQKKTGNQHFLAFPPCFILLKFLLAQNFVVWERAII